jgi:hypothetical protein
MVIVYGVNCVWVTFHEVLPESGDVVDCIQVKTIAQALIMYEHEHGGLPAAAICDKDGKPLLSWRVTILPYVEHDSLYREFKLDEPWDGPNNKKLLDRRPSAYAPCSTAAKHEPTKTYLRVYVGGGAAFNELPAPGPCLCEFADGTEQTLLVVNSEDAVEWTKPDELTYDPRCPPSRLGYHDEGNSSLAAFADGSVHWLKPRLDDATLHALITRSGGENVDPNRFELAGSWKNTK